MGVPPYCIDWQRFAWRTGLFPAIRDAGTAPLAGRPPFHADLFVKPLHGRSL